MQSEFELVNRFAPERNGSSLVFSEEVPFTYRESRVYRFSFSGTEDAMVDFVSRVLADPIRDVICRNNVPYFAKEMATIVDVSYKPEVLDLEKQSVLNCLTHETAGNFEIENIEIIRRVYLQGDAKKIPVSDILPAIVNPVVQNCEVTAWEVFNG